VSDERHQKGDAWPARPAVGRWRVLRTGLPNVWADWAGSPFQLDGSRTRLYYKFFEGHPDMFVVKLTSDSELEFMSQRSDRSRLRKFNIPLHKRTVVVSER
jgi:hypothetical protein